MKKKDYKGFLLFIIVLLLLFAGVFYFKGSKAKIALKDKDLGVIAYNLIGKEFFLDMIDQEASDYDTLEIYLKNDDKTELKIDDDIQSLYDTFNIQLEDPSMIPVGQNIKVRYVASLDGKKSEASFKEKLSHTPITILRDADGNEIQDRYVVDINQVIESLNSIKAYVEKFTIFQEEIPLNVSYNLNYEELGDYTIRVTNKDYDIDKEIIVEVVENDGKAGSLNDVTVLVNKEYHLSADDVPELKYFPLNYAADSEYEAQPVAVDAFIEMVDTMKEETGMVIMVVSTYRSYETQVRLFNNYAETDGIEAANLYSARAGESEHQTGLALDVTNPAGYMDNFGDTKESTWVEENAHRFGFIIRFPEGKEDITGYQYEPWHLRYLGKDLAKKVKDSDLAYDEYWFKYLR